MNLPLACNAVYAAGSTDMTPYNRSDFLLLISPSCMKILKTLLFTRNLSARGKSVPDNDLVAVDTWVIFVFLDSPKPLEALPCHECGLPWAQAVLSGLRIIAQGPQCVQWVPQRHDERRTIINDDHYVSAKSCRSSESSLATRTS